MALPTGVELFKQGWATYKTRARDLLPLILIPTVPAMLGAIVTAVGIPALGGFITFMAFLLTIWSTLAFFYLFLAEPQGISYRDALGRAGGKILPYIGVSLLTAFVMLGALFLFAGIPAGILFTGLYLSHLVTLPVSLAVAGGLGIVISVIVLFRFGLLFTFSLWVFADTGIGGLAALRHSRSLMKGNIARVFWRSFVVGILCAIIGLVVGIIVGIVGAVLTGGNPALSSMFKTLSGELVQIITTPISLGAMYFLYMGLKAEQTAQVAPVAEEGGDKLVPLAILGGLLIPLLLVVAVALAAFAAFSFKSLEAGFDAKWIESATSTMPIEGAQQMHTVPSEAQSAPSQAQSVQAQLAKDNAHAPAVSAAYVGNSTVHVNYVNLPPSFIELIHLPNLEVANVQTSGSGQTDLTPRPSNPTTGAFRVEVIGANGKVVVQTAQFTIAQ